MILSHTLILPIRQHPAQASDEVTN